MTDLDFPLDLLPPDQQKVLAYWRELNGEELRCSFRQFHLSSLPPVVLPSTMIIDVFADSSKNRFRFWGTKMTYIYGRDMTGHCPYDLTPPEMAAVIRAKHEKMAAKPKASASTYVFLRDSGVEHSHYALRLPLSDDGENLSHIAIIVDLSANDAAYRKSILSTAQV